MSIELDKRTVDPEQLRREWQEKHDPNLEDLPGMRAFIEKKMGNQTPTIPEDDLASSGDPGDTQLEPEGTFNNFQQ